MLSKHIPFFQINAYAFHIFQKEENHIRQLLSDHQGNNVCEKVYGKLFDFFFESSMFSFIIIKPVL